MVSTKTTLTNPSGLHLRPASDFVKAMTKYKSNITIIFNEKEIDGKSILNLMAACIKQGSNIEILCDGEDEKQMLDEAIEMIESGFGE